MFSAVQVCACVCRGVGVGYRSKREYERVRENHDRLCGLAMEMTGRIGIYITNVENTKLCSLFSEYFKTLFPGEPVVHLYELENA